MAKRPGPIVSIARTMRPSRLSRRSAIDTMRLGAFDYLTKPCRLIELQALLERVAQKRELTHKYQALKRRLLQQAGIDAK